jgi:hypothetical protein
MNLNLKYHLNLIEYKVNKTYYIKNFRYNKVY